jgi:phenylacetate-coenzyme A ligase PaaK-like adenylate-forming protein
MTSLAGAAVRAHGLNNMASSFGILIRKLRELRTNASLTPEQFAAMKLARFRDLVRYVGERSPWYREVIAERGIDVETCVPADFPPLTKAVLMANFDRIVTDRRLTKAAIADFLSRSRDPQDLFLNRFRIIHTSGSSGEVGYFAYSPEDWARGRAQMMRARASGAAMPKKRHRGRMRMAFYGAVGGHFAGVTMVSAATRGIARLWLKVRFYEVNDPLPQTLSQLNDFQPDLLFGYTGALTILACKQREGALRISPVIISTAGESLGTTDKKIIEEAFGCPAYNGYGSSEHLYMGSVIPGKTSMRLHDDDLIYEMFEDHTLVTNLFNYTVPLIRYRMADILRPVVTKTDPSSPYLEVESLVGRSEMMPRFLNEAGTEDFISPHTINEIFVAGVVRFQLQVTGASSFCFLVCLDPQLNAAQRAQVVANVNARLREILAQKRMANVSADVRVVDDIAVNPRTRKFQLIVDCRTSAAAASA